MISHIGFATIPVTDLDRALVFWRDVMGFDVTADADYMPGMRWVTVRPAGARTHLHFDKVDEMPERDKPALPLIAPDVAAAVEKIRAGGAEIVTEPGPAPWDEETTYAMFNDTEGNLILLSSR